MAAYYGYSKPPIATILQEFVAAGADFDALLQARYLNGSLIIDTANPNTEIIYNVVIPLVQSVGIKETIVYLSKHNKTPQDLYWNLPMMEEERKVMKRESEILSGSSIKPIGPPCTKCGLSQTELITLITRSSDEPQSQKLECYAEGCGFVEFLR